VGEESSREKAILGNLSWEAKMKRVTAIADADCPLTMLEVLGGSAYKE
jgi:hypothetical protein